MPSRTTRLAIALTTAGLLLGAAGCTGGTQTSPRATLAAAASDTVTVVDQADASDLSVRASRALFASAPGAVVAPADDASAVAAAA
uniref:hypothetical protein n=1 Tax=Curtobacterium flaccumfaciens TaxID=2035 RepID=UPI003EE4576D